MPLEGALPPKFIGGVAPLRSPRFPALYVLYYDTTHRVRCALFHLCKNFTKSVQKLYNGFGGVEMRVSLNLSQEMLDRVDAEAKRLGTSRGAMLTAWVGDKIAQLDMSRQMASSIQQDLMSVFKESLKDPAIVNSLMVASGVKEDEK